jgi:ATP-dependent phosphofructokinase / diphosphate-dependent phosphofructokinase
LRESKRWIEAWRWDMNVGILTGGGDCPGLNAVIRAVTRTCAGEHGCSITGIHDGWKGLLTADVAPLDMRSVSGILPTGGTILGTSRTNPFKEEGGPDQIRKNMAELGIDAVVAIGGEDTLGVALKMHQQHNMKVVGIPKTIDNDLSGTDYTFGFDTAVQIATEALDRLHTTAESHDRVMVLEVMGRSAGWIALYTGIAGGADAILIPEFTLAVEDVADLINHRTQRGKHFSLVVVSEGAKIVRRSGSEECVVASEKTDEFGHARLGGVGEQLSKAIEELTGYDTRATVLGHVQRGGTPTARDRVLATRFGVKASEMVRDGDWGKMAALRGDAIEAVPLEEAVREIKTVPRELFDLASTFFG